MPGQNDYLRAMPQKPLDLPMKVAKAFVKDMRAYFAEPNTIKRDEIAGRQLQAAPRHTIRVTGRNYASPP